MFPVVFETHNNRRYASEQLALHSPCKISLARSYLLERRSAKTACRMDCGGFSAFFS